MIPLKYTALIRTNNSLPIVADVVAKLRAQTFPPERILAVDSASTPEQRTALEGIFDAIVDYPLEPFNYSKAINIGVEACHTKYVLIISSHVIVENINLIQNGINLLDKDNSYCLGFCINPQSVIKNYWNALKVNSQNFTPFTGLSNSCAFLQVKSILDRPFREDVFSAEDQEWVAFQIRINNSYFYSIGSSDLKYLNQHINDLKHINEEISMAYFTHPQLRSPRKIVSRLLRSLLAFVRHRPERAKLHLTLAKELFLANFRKPVRKSSYY